MPTYSSLTQMEYFERCLRCEIVESIDSDAADADREEGPSAVC